MVLTPLHPTTHVPFLIMVVDDRFLEGTRQLPNLGAFLEGVRFYGSDGA